MPVDEQLNALLIADLADEDVETSVLRRIARYYTLVSLRARVWRGSTWVSIPGRLPVAVDVSTETCLVWCVCRRWLTVLTPQTLIGLGVDEALVYQLRYCRMNVARLTIRVDEGEDVKIVVIEECLGDVVARLVALNKLLCNILYRTGLN